MTLPGKQRKCTRRAFRLKKRSTATQCPINLRPSYLCLGIHDRPGDYETLRGMASQVKPYSQYSGESAELMLCLFGQVPTLHDNRLIGIFGADRILDDLLKSSQQFLCARIVGTQFSLATLRRLQRPHVRHNLSHLLEEFAAMRNVLFLCRI